MSEPKKFNPPDWKGVQRAMVIMAHPDDPDFSCAGTVMQMARHGIEVTYVILTNGDKGNHRPDVTHNQLMLMRKAEQRAAAALCGVKDVLFMDEEDGFLRPTFELRERLVRIIRAIRPELIICPSPERYFSGDSYINHPDHRNAGLAVLEAIFPAADNPMFYPDMALEGFRPHKISQLYISGHEDVNVEFDITDDMETKIQAILSHTSQFLEPEKLEKWLRERWGDKQEDGSRRYFERFKAMRFDGARDEDDDE
jgi:LmbE family N-acetylglucosaminyl deacetylase